MDQRKQARAARLSMATSIVTAFGASICCIGPIVAVMFGMTSLAALAKYEPLRPVFGAVTFACLGFAFYATYRRTPGENCEPGSLCQTQGGRLQRMNRTLFWIATAAAVLMFTFPAWSAWVLG